MADDPNYFHHSQSSDRLRPMWVTGFAFDPAARLVDFSAVPGFDLARLESLRHSRTGAYLYVRPLPTKPTPYGLAEVDGAPVQVPPPTLPPTVGKVLKVGVDCSGMAAGDDILAAYDPPTGG